MPLRPASAPKATGRCERGESKSSNTSVFPSGTSCATAHSASRGAARIVCVSVTRRLRRSAKKRHRLHGFADAGRIGERLRGKPREVEIAHFGGNRRSRTTSSARSASTRSVPSMITSLPIAGALSRKS